MTRDVIAVPPELSLRHAWGILQRWSIRHLPVVTAGRVVGVLSDRDVLLHAHSDTSGSIVVPEMPVAVAMTAKPITCERATPIADIVRLMIQHKIDSVVVLDAHGVLVGLVTSTDLLMLLVVGASRQPLPFEFTVRDEAAAGV